MLCARVQPGTVKHSWSGKWHKSQRQNNDTSSGTSQIVNISADVYEDAICGNHLHLTCNWKRGVHPASDEHITRKAAQQVFRYFYFFSSMCLFLESQRDDLNLQSLTVQQDGDPVICGKPLGGP